MQDLSQDLRAAIGFAKSCRDSQPVTGGADSCKEKGAKSKTACEFVGGTKGATEKDESGIHEEIFGQKEGSNWGRRYCRSSGDNSRRHG